jgi:hypothetical protein
MVSLGLALPIQGFALCEGHLLLEVQPGFSDPLGGDSCLLLFLACPAVGRGVAAGSIPASLWGGTW